MTHSRYLLCFSVTLLAASLVGLPSSTAGESNRLLVGGAQRSITPDQPVALSGQFHTRIASEVESPCTATALAIESRQGEQVVDQAILVSCDLVAIREGVLAEVREQVRDRLDKFDAEKLVLSATHTHTAPVMVEGKYPLPEEGVMPVGEYRSFLVERLAEAAVEAWQARQPARVGWGLGHAVVARNRRAVYADGHAQMYGATDRQDFREIEGYEDHEVNVLFFWDADEQLIATAVNVACPSQEVEGRSAVNADFWHPVRQELRKRYGDQLFVLGWTGASGDQSPHLMYGEPAEERMRRLRGLSQLEEIARRVVSAWEEAHEGARQDIRSEVPLAHRVEQIELPARLVTDEEYEEAKAEVAALSEDPANQRRAKWHQRAVDRYESQSDGDTHPMELHVLRIGDVAIATNRFELFTDFGIQIKSRSPAVQTFVVQLAGAGSYLPSERAVRGGGYSAVVQSSIVGPEGGQVLVEETVEQIESLWQPESEEDEQP